MLKSKEMFDEFGDIYKRGFLDGYNHAVDTDAYETEEELPDTITGPLDEAIKKLKNGNRKTKTNS